MRARRDIGIRFGLIEAVESDIPADELAPYQATATVISAGDAGANNFAAFRRQPAALGALKKSRFPNLMAP